LRLGPPGRWWDDPEFIKKLGLSDDQQKKMDDIFNSGRLNLIDLFAAVQKEEAIMEPLVAADPPDENKLLAQASPRLVPNSKKRTPHASGHPQPADPRTMAQTESGTPTQAWPHAWTRRRTRRWISARQAAALTVGLEMENGRPARLDGRTPVIQLLSERRLSRPAKDRDACMTDRNRPGGRPSIDSTNRNSKKIGFPALQPLQASLTLFIFGRSIRQTSSSRCGQATAGGRGTQLYGQKS
jgi:hypothetical protein